MTTNLSVYQDGHERKLMDWIQEKGMSVYRDVGKKTWRVPPVKFNMQKLSEQKLTGTQNDKQNMRIEGRILGQPNITDQETNRAENVVCGAFEKLSNYLVQFELGSAMFLISNFEYDNYLNKLSNYVTETKSDEVTGKQTDNIAVEPTGTNELSQASRTGVKLPKDVARRGELDILILHQEAGIILVQTKAVGYNFFGQSPQFERCHSVRTAVEKAGEQLSRDRSVMMYIMDDLGLQDDQMTAVVALPNLPRSVLLQEMGSDLKHKVRHEFNLDIDTNFLCEEDLKPDVDGCYRALEKWWTQSLLPLAKGMDIQTMQQIAFRTVGLLSTVSVWSYAQPRIEVRNLNEAAWETGNRYTQVVLSPQQVELLKHEDQYLYLCGPAGSGKTLLLSLKGRQWLRRDCNVAILNTRLGSRGRTVGQVIETTINKSEGLKKHVIRIDLDLMDNEEALSSIVAEHVKGQTFNFLLDEVAWVKETDKLLLLLKKSYPYSSIWCAGMLIECQPEGFQTGSLEVILRCPPSVQRVLRIVDNRDERCGLYKLDSAKAGLPTDGLPTFFIIHSRHGDPSIQPYDCPICARELSDLLINNLNLTSKIINQESQTECIQSDCSKSNGDGIICAHKSQCDDVETNPLSKSISSDSGCDVESNADETSFRDMADLESDLIQDKNKSYSCVIEDRNGNVIQLKENKRNRSKFLENNNPGEVVKTTISDALSPDIISGNICGSKIQDCISKKNPNQNKINKGDSDTITKKSKARPKKSGRNLPAKDSSELAETKLCKGNFRKNQNLSKISESENVQVTTTSEHEDSRSNDNTAISCNSSKKTKSGKRKLKHKINAADGSKDCTTYQQLNFSDVVLPVTVPRMWHHYNQRGYWSISRGALAQEMVLLGSRAFCQELYYSGVPLKVEEAMVMKTEGKAQENHFVMCPVGAVHGLEYKLVICVPSACDIPEYIEISEGIRHGQMEPKVMMKRTQFGTDYLKSRAEPWREQNVSEILEKNVPKIDKVRISTHVAEPGAPYDFLYEPLSEDDTQWVLEDTRIPKILADPPRPWVPPTYSDEEIQTMKDELCGHCGDKDKCVCQYFKSDQLAALHRLDAWNKAYVLMCASRCTSTLVLVLP